METPRHVGPSLPGRATTVPHASLATSPAPHCTVGQCLACQLSSFLFPSHIHSCLLSFFWIHWRCGQRKAQQELTHLQPGQFNIPYLLMPHQKLPTWEVTMQTIFFFPIFYCLQSEGRTTSPTPRSQDPHGGAHVLHRWHAEQGGFACTKPP